jgi:hypothetical protein
VAVIVMTSAQSLVGRLVSTVVVGAVVPLVGWVTAYAMVGDDMRRTLRGRGRIDLGFGDVSNLDGVAMMAFPIACLVLLGAFYLTESRHPIGATVLCAAILPLWFIGLNGLDVRDTLAYFLLLGAPPAAIRLFMPVKETDVSITGLPPGTQVESPRR